MRAAAGITLEVLIADPGRILSPDAVAKLDEWAARRAAREPLPYILGKWEFYSRSFVVSSAAIVPRPETELLAEAAIHRIHGNAISFAVDIGTGSGALAVTLAAEVPHLRVAATDISLSALRLAARNIELHGVSDRVWPVCCDLLTAIGRPAGCIVANLPYIAHDDFASLDPEVRDYEPRIALDGGLDGLGMIRRLSAMVCAHLYKGGFAALEVGAGQAQQAAKLLACGGLSDIEVLPDLARIERVVVGWRRGHRDGRHQD